MTNPYETWERKHCTEPNHFKYMHNAFLYDNPEIAGADTETTGLHIKKDKPFLIIFGWVVGDTGKVFTFEPTPQRMNLFFKLAKMANMFVLQNSKYDLHMLSNIGYERQVQDMTNLVENMALARLSFEAVPAREGGDSLALKDIGTKYVHHLANQSENSIKAVKKELEGERTKVLAAALKQFPLVLNGEQQLTPAGKPAKWGKGAVKKFLKDPTQDVEDLPLEVREVWEEWHKQFPDEVTYKDIYDHNPEAMLRYAGDDVITMLEFARMSLPLVTQREQLSVLKRENDVILPLYRMERVGLKVDQNYLEESRIRTKAHIIKQRKKLTDLAQEKITCNQHARIKEIFLEKWNIPLEASDSAAMKLIQKEHDGEPSEFASLISELRTLEKWYSTYILRIQANVKYDGRFYTQISQCSAVSGRVGSDSQQFPKKGIQTKEGVELYHPRKVFVTPGDVDWYFLDFDQVELKVQANYTLLVSGGDLNLCRAYFPFKCHNTKTGKLFDYKDKNDMLERESGEWVDDEKIPWKETDVHGQTTHNAFPHIPLGTSEFKEWRSKGKVFNFMANYGGGKTAAMKSLGLEEEQADALVRGYAEAFPHVKVYQNQVIKRHRKQGYVTNMFGRRYYLKNMNKGYKLANYLIQGTCADDLKECVIDIDKLLLDKKSAFVMTVHDECSFYIHPTEKHLVAEIRAIMEREREWCFVPITAGVEKTETDWSEKYECSQFI